MDGPHSMTAFLKPATPGARVTFPMTRDALPEEGALVELSSYWRERIRDGSVVQVVEKAQTSETARKALPRAAAKKD